MSFALRLPAWTIPLLRRGLYLFVRTRVFPQDTAELGLDPAKPICYVLQHRRMTNFLVLEEETRRAGMYPARAPLAVGGWRSWRSFFFLTRPQPLTGKAKDRYGHSPLVGAMVRAVLADPAADVQLVPVTILWGQAPKQQNSILKALFAETWRPPSQLRQLLSILLHGRQTLVRFDAPLSLRALLDGTTDEAQALRKLGRVLRVHYRRQREMAIGPDLSHRNTQVNALLAAPTVRHAIAAEVAGRGRAAMRWRSPRTTAMAWCAPSSSFSTGCGTGSTTASTSIASPPWPASPRARASSMCPAIVATSTTCCCRSSYCATA